jgi:hypothetical protein
MKKRGPAKGYMKAMEDRLADLEAMVKDKSQDQVLSPSESNTMSSQAEVTTMSPIASDTQVPDIRRDSFAQPGQSARSEKSQDFSSALGQLSTDENLTMRYHGAASGLQLITSSNRFSEPFWNFPNPGYWPRTSSKIVMTEDEIISEADATDGPVLPSIEVQDHLLE